MTEDTAGWDSYRYFYGSPRRYPLELPYERDDAKYVPPIFSATVEQFLVKFPEFSGVAQDPNRGVAYLESELQAVRIEIELGEWPVEIVEETTYLLLAHRLQLSFQQAADTAVRGVAAAKGKSKVSERSAEYDPSLLSSTTYGSRLESLRAVAQFGGIVI